jgi:hypothetical protein
LGNIVDITSPDLLVRVLVRRFRMSVSMLTVLVGRHRMLFGGFMIAVFVVMRRLMMVVSRSVMMSGGLQMMFARFVFFGRGHGFLL